MNDSVFDPSTFLDATTTEANTRRPPVPAGTDLVGIIGEPVPRQTQGVKDPSKTYLFLDIPITFDLNEAPNIKEITGVDQLTLRHSISLDTTPSGALDNSKGKNGGLRVLREALGMNNPGEPFSIRAIQGRRIRAKIKQRTYQGELFDEIDSVAKV
jgi:hypothetical protein